MDSLWSVIACGIEMQVPHFIAEENAGVTARFAKIHGDGRKSTYSVEKLNSSALGILPMNHFATENQP